VSEKRPLPIIFSCWKGIVHTLKANRDQFSRNSGAVACRESIFSAARSGFDVYRAPTLAGSRSHP
jgi:hypothetical protein